MATINDLGMPNPISVPFGGLGVSSNATPYGVICAGTTGTGNIQQVVGLGNAGQALFSNGAAALPSWQNQTGGVPNFTDVTPWTPVLSVATSGAYTPYTYTVQSGHYSVVGSIVFINATLVLNNANTGLPGGIIGITNLPVNPTSAIYNLSCLINNAGPGGSPTVTSGQSLVGFTDQFAPLPGVWFIAFAEQNNSFLIVRSVQTGTVINVCGYYNS